MIECKYRIQIQQNQKGPEKKSLGRAMTKSVGPGFTHAAISANLQQTFDCGLCEALTAVDMGPVECRQPEKDEETCPDIAHLK